MKFFLGKFVLLFEIVDLFFKDLLGYINDYIENLLKCLKFCDFNYIFLVGGFVEFVRL